MHCTSADEDISDRWDTTSEEGDVQEAIPQEVNLRRQGDLPDVVVPTSATGEHLFALFSGRHSLCQPSLQKKPTLAAPISLEGMLQDSWQPPTASCEHSRGMFGSVQPPSRSCAQLCSVRSPLL